MLKSWVYQILTKKLQRIKKYLKEYSKKESNNSNTGSYASLILFAVKLNGQLCFFIDYRKLNAITKRNQYFIPFIDEILVKIINGKYLTKFDIIARFKKNYACISIAKILLHSSLL